MMTSKDKQNNVEKKTNEDGKKISKKSSTLLNLFQQSNGMFTDPNETLEEKKLYLRVSHGYNDSVGNDDELSFSLENDNAPSSPKP